MKIDLKFCYCTLENKIFYFNQIIQTKKYLEQLSLKVKVIAHPCCKGAGWGQQLQVCLLNFQISGFVAF